MVAIGDMNKTYSLTLLLMIGLICFSFSNAAADSAKYKVGVIIPLTGQIASMGNFVKRGIDLAMEDLPSSERNLIDVVYEDDQFESAKTVSAYRKLKQSKLDAVFVIGSPPANALGPITERDGTILMAIGASDSTIAVGKNLSFIHWVIPPVLGDKLASELIRKDFKRIAFIAAEASGTIADQDAVIKSLRDNGRGNVVALEETYLKEATDYRSTIVKLRQKKVDAVVVCLFPGALSSFAKQFRDAKLDAELIGMETFENEDEVKASEGSLIGKIYVNSSDPSPSFIKRYTKKYGEHPGWAAGNGYDSLRLIAAAVHKVGAGNVAIRDYLRAVKDFNGASGVFSASGDNRFTLPAALKRVTANGFVSLDGNG